MGPVQRCGLPPKITAREDRERRAYWDVCEVVNKFSLQDELNQKNKDYKAHPKL